MLPVVVDQAVVGDAVEPGGKLRQRLVVGAGVDDFQPDVLIELLGQARIAALVGQVAVEFVAVTGVERLECRRIAVAIGEHQAFVAEVVVHGGQFSSPMRYRCRAAGTKPVSGIFAASTPTAIETGYLGQ